MILQDVHNVRKKERMMDMSSARTFIAASLTVFFGYLSGVLTVFFRGGVSRDFALSYVASELTPQWLRAFESGPFYVLLVFLCGLFLFGWLFALPLIFYKSFGLGYTAGLFLAAFGAKGFLPLGLCLFPSAAAECVLLIRGARDALPQSFLLFRGMKGDAAPFFQSLKPYLLRSLVIFQCSAFVLLWDLFLSPLILSGIRDLL